MVKIIYGTIFILFMILMSRKSFAYDVNIKDLGNDKVAIEVVDNCNKSFRLTVTQEELGTSKTLEWLQNLINSEKIDKCIDNDDNT